MSQTLLIVERVVLESLETRDLTLDELEDQTGFANSLLKGVLNLLISKNIVMKDQTYYCINWDMQSQWQNIVSNELGIKAELAELLNVMIENKKIKNHTFRMQKIWLEPREKEVLKRKLEDIESYLTHIKDKRKTKPVREQTIGKQVLMFALSPYETLVDGVMKSA